jgi:carbon monoxide dehydrogenase subunit G
MRVSGEAVVHAPVERVYAALQDPAILVRVIPGCGRLEQVGPDAYRASVLAGVGAVKGLFDGDVRLADHVAPHRFTLHASGAGAPGTVVAEVAVALADGVAGTTVVSYDADATIGGVIGGVGQRMLAGVARRTAGEFFAAVDRELTGTGAAAVTEAALEEANRPVPMPGPATGVWTSVAPAGDPLFLAARRRFRDFMAGAAFATVVALLGVLVGALVARR